MENASMSFLPGASTRKGYVQKGELPSVKFAPSTDNGSSSTPLTVNTGTIIAFVYVAVIFYIYT
jgi:hypothetical protein